MSVVSKITQHVVGFVIIVMADLHSLGPGADESLHDKSMDQEAPRLALLAQSDVVVPVLHHARLQDAARGGGTREALHTPEV
jgi:hypothetical protein